jgi:hypothetical protein
MLFFCSLKGLNLVLSICMGLSIGEVTKGWVDITGEKLVFVINVGSCIATLALPHDQNKNMDRCGLKV